ncbi:PucR family transcriptional regulator [Nocardia yunnanensis]|uniref:PucR family transcriptional regulator n=2 Tax=Nocardia yunnanensis TaxID=2382165 RepID=A0A386ZE09_9NOCA|nr:PucR family transcriptional regulator [Nocardia yunnanensis]
MPDLGLELVTGDAELDRDVRGTVTTDLLEPGRYLSGGELVLTGLHWRQRPDDSDTFVRALAAAGVTGMVAGQARYGGIPEDVVAACERHAVPLLRVPEAVSFAVVTERVHRELSTGSAAELSTMLDRHRRHLAGDGLPAVLELLDGLGIRCWILAPTGRVVAGTTAAPPADAAAAFLAANTLPIVLRDNDIAYTIVAADGRIPRFLDWLLIIDVDCAEWTPEQRRLIDDLAGLVAQVRGRRHEDDAHTRQLFDRIAAGTPAAQLATRLELTGLGADGRYQVVAAAGPRAPYLVELPGLLCEILDGRSPVAVLIDEIALAVIPADTDADADIRRTVAALTPGLRGDRLAVGISAAADADGLRDAVEEARYACRLAAEHSESGGVVGRADLTSRTGLLASVPERMRRTFRDSLLAPLHDYDRTHSADLVHTLEIFLDLSGSWARCAEVMFVHVNTLRYRIQRIEELTGRDLSRFEDRVDFFLALALR